MSSKTLITMVSQQLTTERKALNLHYLKYHKEATVLARFGFPRNKRK
jgi:hypothetical protein